MSKLNPTIIELGNWQKYSLLDDSKTNMCWIIFCLDIGLADWNWCMNHTVWWVKLLTNGQFFRTSRRNRLNTLKGETYRYTQQWSQKRYQRESSRCKPFELIHLSLRKLCCVLMLQRKHLCEAFFEDFCSQESLIQYKWQDTWISTCLILHDFLSVKV